MKLDAKRKALEIELAWEMHEKPLAARVRLRATLSEQQNHRCCWCGIRTTQEGDRAATFEHVVPRSAGGSDDPDNLAIACADCNSTRRSDIRWEPQNVVTGRRCYG